MSEECRFCGAEENLEEHHVVPVRLAASLSDLQTIMRIEDEKITVCASCHLELERIYSDEVLELIHKAIEEGKQDRDVKRQAELMRRVDEANGL